MLRNRGAPPFTIDDALQTAALRALCRSEGFDSLDGMVRWVTVVAWHEVQAEWRRQARVEFGELPDHPGGDPAIIVESRLALEVVTEGIAELSDEQREALLVPEDDSSRRRSGAHAAAIKMRRHRARQRLERLVRDEEEGSRGY